MALKKRGRLYIDRDVQRALLWQLFRHWTIFIAMLVGMLLAFEAFAEGPPKSLLAALQNLWLRHATLFVVIATLFPVFAYDSIKLSHRFVGPVMRLRGALRSAADGEPIKPLKFRENDFWHDMADSFNDLVERLQSGGECRAGTPTENWQASAATSLREPDEKSVLQEV